MGMHITKHRFILVRDTHTFGRKPDVRSGAVSRQRWSNGYVIQIIHLCLKMTDMYMFIHIFISKGDCIDSTSGFGTEFIK